MTATADQAGLLQAIREAPGDDAMRLIYADWLVDNGEEERAIYIRTFVERARLPDCGHDWINAPGGWKCPTCRRKDELYEAATNEDGLPVWERHYDGWIKPLKAGEVEMARGFVASITLSLDAFMTHAPAIFAAHPVTAVRLADRGPRPEKGQFGWWDTSKYGRRLAGLAGLACHNADDLPAEIWSLLDGYTTPPASAWGTGSRGVVWRVYETEEDAHAALCRACVKYGRRLAGLPPLEVS